MNKISIVIPVYNEEKYIIQVLAKILALKYGVWQKEIIIVDDGSTDQTALQLKKYLKKHPKSFKLITLKQNQGKGEAVKRGFLISSGEIVMIQDADLEYDPKNHLNVLQTFANFNADVVYGSRFITNEPRRVMYFWHYFANLIITFLSNLFTNLNLTDVETGQKAFKGSLIRKIAPSLKAKRFGFEIEITAKLSKIKKIKIFEVGVSYNGRSYEEGKKITWRDGLLAIWQVLRFNLWGK